MFKFSKINTKYLLASFFLSLIFVTLIYLLINYLPQRNSTNFNQNVISNNDNDHSNNYSLVVKEDEKQNSNNSDIMINKVTSEKQNSKSLKQVLIELTDDNKTAEELFIELNEYLKKDQEINFQILKNYNSYVEQDEALLANIRGQNSTEIIKETLTLRCKHYFDWRINDSLLQKKQTSNLVEMLVKLGKKVNESDECLSMINEFNQTFLTLVDKLIENAKKNRDSNCIGFTNQTELENFIINNLSEFSDDISNIYSKSQELRNSCKKINAISQALANEEI